ncbi:MAG: HAD family phosphatase [Dehalococcoidales bacterium]
MLWDMDGTIVNSLPFHKQAWQITFAKRGKDFTDADFQWANGRRNEEIIPHFLKRTMPLTEVNAIADEKEATFRHLVKGSIKALPGVIELIKSLAAAEYRLAVVSSTPEANIELVTKTLGIKKYFSLLVNGDDVKEGKPSPQCFLLGAEKLGIAAQNCVVMEDAVVGVRAAKSAGMHCIAVANTCPRTDIAEADIVVDSLAEINVKTIEALLASPPKK